MLCHPGAEFEQFMFRFFQKRLYCPVIKILKLHVLYLTMKPSKTAQQVTGFFMSVFAGNIIQTVIYFTERIDD